MTQPSIDINPKHRVIVQNILSIILPINSKVWVFGSRATGATKKSSDLDIVIDAGRPLNRQEELILADAFEESNLPYRVDVLDMHTVSDEFKEIIQKEMVTFTFE